MRGDDVGNQEFCLRANGSTAKPSAIRAIETTTRAFIQETHSFQRL
jgi:hypothetical protein